MKIPHSETEAIINRNISLSEFPKIVSNGNANGNIEKYRFSFPKTVANNTNSTPVPKHTHIFLQYFATSIIKKTAVNVNKTDIPKNFKTSALSNCRSSNHFFTQKTKEIVSRAIFKILKIESIVNFPKKTEKLFIGNVSVFCTALLLYSIL